MIKPFTIYASGSGEPIGELWSKVAAHKIAHSFLAAWPDVDQLTVRDELDGSEWIVKPGECAFIACGTGPASTDSGLPIRTPGPVLLSRRDVVVDVALLQRVLDGLRQL